MMKAKPQDTMEWQAPAEGAAAHWGIAERDAAPYYEAPIAEGDNNAFAALVDHLPADRAAAVAAIRSGFPATLLKDASVYFDVPASRIRAVLRLPETTAATLVKRGASLDAGVSERIWRLADLVHMARDVFEARAAATHWLRTPNRTFQGAAPMDYLDTEPGAMSVRQVLNAMATGGVA